MSTPAVSLVEFQAHPVAKEGSEIETFVHASLFAECVCDNGGLMNFRAHVAWLMGPCSAGHAGVRTSLGDDYPFLV